MGIKITVVDTKNHLAAGIEVFIKWKGGGTSRGKTDSGGQFDTKVTSRSTIDEITVDGKKKGYSNVELTVSDGLQVSIDRAVT